MKPQQVFDSVSASLGFRTGAELAAALGRTKKSASYWRHSGFPKRLHSELQVLAGKLGKPLPPEFYAATGIPAPRQGCAGTFPE